MSCSEAASSNPPTELALSNFLTLKDILFAQVWTSVFLTFKWLWRWQVEKCDRWVISAINLWNTKCNKCNVMMTNPYFSVRLKHWRKKILYSIWRKLDKIQKVHKWKIGKSVSYGWFSDSVGLQIARECWLTIGNSTWC